MPTGRGALENLVPALDRLLSAQRPINIDPTMAGFFTRLSQNRKSSPPTVRMARPRPSRR